MLVTDKFDDKRVLCRENTYDEKIAIDVLKRQCYKLLRINEHDIVLDAGANIGTFTLWASSRCQHVVAVEPEPNNMTLLLENCRSNSIDNYTPLLGAVVGNNDKFRPIYVNLGANKAIHGLIPKRGRHTINVSCFNINKLIKLYDISAMKIDVEGSEVEILEGIKDEYWKRIQKIAIEYHFQILKDWDYHIYHRLIKLLHKHFDKMNYNKEVNKRWTGMIYGWKKGVGDV